MERVSRQAPATNAFGQCIQPQATGNWAESPVLYMLTCYDVWSATPSRGCEPARAHAADAPAESGAEA